MLPAGIAFAAGVLAYATTLGHGFVWDDSIWLEQRLRFYPSILNAFVDPPGVPGFPGVYRPLTVATFWIDQRLWWRNPFGFHLTSILAHGLSSALVCLLARRLGCSTGAAVVGAVLFAVHPVHTESVAWITSRVDVLATLFTLATILAFLRWRRRGEAAALGAVALGAFAAAASKEPGAVAPFLLLAVPLASGAAAGASVQRERRPWLAVAAALAGLFAYLALRPSDRGTPGSHLHGLDATGLAHLLAAFGFYVQRTLVPWPLDAYLPELPAGALAVGWSTLGLAGLAALVLVRPTDGGLRRFAATWFVLTLAPSLLVVLADISVTPVAERYLYLPSVGFSLLVATELSRRPRLLTARAGRVGIALVLAVLALLTTRRNRVWHDELTLWSEVARRQPGFALPHLNLGLALANAGRLEEAERTYREGLAARGSETTRRDMLVNLGHVALQQGRLDDAADLFTRANAIAPHASAHYGLGGVARSRARALLAEGATAQALEELVRARASLAAALAINPRHYQSHFMLASVFYLSGDFAGAAEQYEQVVRLAGDTPTGRQAAENFSQLTAWLSDPAHRQDPR